MSFTEETWKRTERIYQAIIDMPFVQALGDGSLDPRIFTDYMAQDALYLAEYGRVLAGVATLSSAAEDCQFWAGSAVTAVVAERELHAQFVDISQAREMNPTCRAYTNHLLASLSSGSYGVAAAAVLPCFWIYLKVGQELLRKASEHAGNDALEGHPYAEWIRLYADAEFEKSVRQARALVDRAAAAASPEERERMHQSYLTSARYEWMFWDAPWRHESWPV